MTFLSRFLNPGNLAGLLAILLWSTSVGFSRSISEKIGPLKAGASIYLMAGLFLTVLNFFYQKTKTPLKKPSWRYQVGCGSLFFLYAVTFFLALGLARDHHQVLE